MAARWFHKPEVGGSIPPSATITYISIDLLGVRNVRGYIIQPARVLPRTAAAGTIAGHANTLILHNIDFKGYFRAVQRVYQQSA